MRDGRGFRVGDKVKFLGTSNTHAPLRYQVDIGAIGTVTYIFTTENKMFVDWGQPGEGAMTMWFPEVELVLPASNTDDEPF